MHTFKLKDYNSADTIAAIATFPSPAALGIIKISGKKAIPIISKLFLSRNKKDIKKVKTYTLHYGWIIAPSTKRILRLDLRSRSGQVAHSVKNNTPHVIIDEVLVSVMRAPNSYTREDVVEISCHGGVLVLNKILQLILRQGARLALPGEFTYRAFIKGRIDLIKAQSILSIIDAKSEQSLALAGAQLKGNFSAKIAQLQKYLKGIFAETEAFINFPEDEVKIDLFTLKKRLVTVERRLSLLLQGSKEAQVLKEGLRCVICGRTNVGKSTLFNCLLGEERVIVSRLPGTTRDVIEETINIRGIPLKIYDTAGILEPRDLIDKKAIKKTMQSFREADLIILVIDGSRPLSKDDIFLFEKVNNSISNKENNEKNILTVVNKSDLKQKLCLKNIATFGNYKVKLSALKKKGIKDLEQAIFNLVYKKGIRKEDIIFLGAWQRQALRRAQENICAALKFLQDGHPADFVNLSLNEAVVNLSRLSGEVYSEDIIEDIFSKFCIGK
jgi:tRNA modification GTPase